MSSSDGQAAALEMRAARLRLATEAVSAALAIGFSLWILTPEHRRQAAAARMRRAAAPAVTAVLERAHRAAVRRAMDRELAGLGEDYVLSERIRSRLALWAGLR